MQSLHMARTTLSALVTAVAICLAAGQQAEAYGLFACVDPAGNTVCEVDTGTMTGFDPAALCAARCPACAGQCSGVRLFPRGGHWRRVWQGTPGMTDDNRMTPGQDSGREARTMIQNGLAGPATPQPVPGGDPGQPQRPLDSPGPVR